MAEPFIGEIKLFSFDWPPKNYARCDGAILPIKQNQTLYSLMGSAYGGDGRTTFGLPEMRGRTPVGESFSAPDYDRGNQGGFEGVTLNANQIAGHRHTACGSSQNGNRPLPLSTTCLATSPNAEDLVYGEAASLVAMKSDIISSEGGGGAHANMQPYLVINFCIALVGAYPSRD